MTAGFVDEHRPASDALTGLPGCHVLVPWAVHTDRQLQ